MRLSPRKKDLTSRTLNKEVGVRGPPQFLNKRSENAGANENVRFMWVPTNSGNRSGSCSENCGVRIAQVAGCHSENGISNSESCSENSNNSRGSQA